MNSEERFGKWVAVGMPLLLGGGIVGTIAVHMGYQIFWRHLLIPASLYVALQIGAYLGAFWARKCARQQSRYWPMFLLSGFYLWATGWIILQYGSRWGILPRFDDFLGFSILMALTTAIICFVAVKFGRKIGNAWLQQSK